MPKIYYIFRKICFGDLLRFKNYYKSFLIGLVFGLIITFIHTPDKIAFIVIIVAGLISGYIASKEIKIGIINGVISSLGFPIATILFYTVRSIEGFSIPIIPVLIIGLILMLVVTGLLGAFGGIIGSYIKNNTSKD